MLNFLWDHCSFLLQEKYGYWRCPTKMYWFSHHMLSGFCAFISFGRGILGLLCTFLLLISDYSIQRKENKECYFSIRTGWQSSAIGYLYIRTSLWSSIGLFRSVKISSPFAVKVIRMLSHSLCWSSSCKVLLDLFPNETLSILVNNFSFANVD